MDSKKYRPYLIIWLICLSCLLLMLFIQNLTRPKPRIMIDFRKQYDESHPELRLKIQAP